MPIKWTVDDAESPREATGFNVASQEPLVSSKERRPLQKGVVDCKSIIDSTLSKLLKKRNQVCRQNYIHLHLTQLACGYSRIHSRPLKKMSSINTSLHKVVFENSNLHVIIQALSSGPAIFSSLILGIKA